MPIYIPRCDDTHVDIVGHMLHVEKSQSRISPNRTGLSLVNLANHTTRHSPPHLNTCGETEDSCKVNLHCQSHQSHHRMQHTPLSHMHRDWVSSRPLTFRALDTHIFYKIVV